MRRLGVERAVLLAMLALLAGGCILIRTTEQRVKFNKDGSGEALLRLIDLRSDAEEDSLVQKDFDIMMSSFQGEAVQDFARKGRQIVRKQLFLNGDTLTAEIVYTFRDPGAIEGLRMTKDEIYVIVPPERRVVRTNGSVSAWGENGSRITWSRDAERIAFAIQERSLGPTRSLAPYYRKYSQ